MPSRIITGSPEQTRETGRQLGTILRAGETVCLWGGLGAGKTTMVQGICLGLGVSEDVVSPSFSLINEYQGRMMVYHVDLYRLEGEWDAGSLGLEECLYGQGVSLIEWPGRATGLLPVTRLDIRLTRMDESSRLINISAEGSTWHDRIGD